MVPARQSAEWTARRIRIVHSAPMTATVPRTQNWKASPDEVV